MARKPSRYCFLHQGAPQGGPEELQAMGKSELLAATFGLPGTLSKRSTFALAHWGHSTFSSPKTNDSKL